MKVDRRRGPRTAEVKAKLSAALKGFKWAPELIAKRALAQTGLKRSPETIAKFKERMKGKCFIPREAILRSAEKRRGQKLTAEHRANLVKAANRYPLPIKQAQKAINKLKKSIDEKQDNGSS